MCSCVTQHNATDVSSFEGVCNWHADCRNVHQSCYQNWMFADVNIVNSAPWWQWGYGMGKQATDHKQNCILLMAIWMHRDTVTRSWGPLCHSSTAITPCFSLIMHVERIWTQFLEAENVPVPPWPAYSPDMSPIWACLGCSGSTCTTTCSSSRQYPATSHSQWRGVGQHSTGHNQQLDQLYAKEMSCCMRQMVFTPDTDWFSDPRV